MVKQHYSFSRFLISRRQRLTDQSTRIELPRDTDIAISVSSSLPEYAFQMRKVLTESKKTAAPGGAAAFDFN